MSAVAVEDATRCSAGPRRGSGCALAWRSSVASRVAASERQAPSGVPGVDGIGALSGALAAPPDGRSGPVFGPCTNSLCRGSRCVTQTARTTARPIPGEAHPLAEQEIRLANGVEAQLGENFKGVELRITSCPRPACHARQLVHELRDGVHPRYDRRRRLGTARDRAAAPVARQVKQALRAQPSASSRTRLPVQCLPVAGPQVQHRGRTERFEKIHISEHACEDGRLWGGHRHPCSVTITLLETLWRPLADHRAHRGPVGPFFLSQ